MPVVSRTSFTIFSTNPVASSPAYPVISIKTSSTEYTYMSSGETYFRYTLIILALYSIYFFILGTATTISTSSFTFFLSSSREYDFPSDLPTSFSLL